MDFDFDPKLIEDASVCFIRRREEQGDYSAAEQYHALADPIYDEPFEAREPLFKKLFSNLFVRFGLAQAVAEAFGDFPKLEAGLEKAFLRKAPSDEGADLLLHYQAPDGRHQKAILVKVAPGRLADPVAAKKFLNHELLHASDLLDETFVYSCGSALPGSALEPHILDRYRAIWDIHVDSRLISQNKETLSAKEERFEEFSAFYSKFPLQIRRRSFEALWAARNLTHPEMLAMARDPGELLRRCGAEQAGDGFQGCEAGPLPGSRCPLCNFPTYIWAEQLGDHAAAAVKADFPDWAPDRGCCTRCAELYNLPAAAGA